MNTTTTYPSTATGAFTGLRGMFYKAQSFLDDKGRGAWIATMVAGFIFVWPLGLAILAYMLMTNRFRRSDSYVARPSRNMMASSGNRAFDAYKEETLRRLQEEQDTFADFLGRLRDAKDKAEFDQFMADRDSGTKDEDEKAANS